MRPPQAEGSMAGVMVAINRTMCALKSVIGNDDRFISASIRQIISLASGDNRAKDISSASLSGKRFPKNRSTSTLNDSEGSGSIDVFIRSKG